MRAARLNGAVRSLLLPILPLLAAFGLLAAAAPAAAAPVTVTDYTDPSEFQEWGKRSHWKQPWRSYLDTVPATTLRDAVGINFNVPPKLAEQTARLLGRSGFERARVEVGWGTMDYEDPTRMEAGEREDMAVKVRALRDHGIRPLILLNAHHGKPCPLRNDEIGLLEAAEVGDTELRVEPGEIGKIVPGRTGITAEGVAAAVLITAVSDAGLATLSRPLPISLPAGQLAIKTLRFAPFRTPYLPDASPNPLFEETLGGWLDYVRAVTGEVEEILGSEEFDVEIWNELSFGSRFLHLNAYYEPDVESGLKGYGTDKGILFRTVELLRDPANGVPHIGIGNGFSNQSPWWNGTNSPPGLTAIDKHPYAGWKTYPAQATVNGNRPLNGLGELDGWQDDDGDYHESFTPTYDAFFPEHFLSGLRTETMVHDLSPFTSVIAGVPHGRFTGPEGSDPPAMWITEHNLAPGRGPTPASSMSDADIRHVETKIVLRDLVAYVNKGVTALHFYAAKGRELSLVEDDFFNAVYDSPSTYPGDALGGETTEAVGRLSAALAGSAPIAQPRELALAELTDYEGNVQFEGDGTPQYPTLYNRDVFAFLPFQVNSRRFVVPVYVMTRNVAEVYEPGSGPRRFDMPPERYRMAIDGVDGESTEVGAYDPLADAVVPVDVVERSPSRVVVEMDVTDSPRLLRIEDGGEAVPVENEDPAPADDAGPDPETGREGASRPVRPAGRAAARRRPPRLRLLGGRALLGRGRMLVVSRCGDRCPVRVRGRLFVGRRGYPVLARTGRSTRTRGGAIRTVVNLQIRGRTARRGRRALNRGRKVRLLVEARARSAAGVGNARRAILLRRLPRYDLGRR